MRESKRTRDRIHRLETAFRWPARLEELFATASTPYKHTRRAFYGIMTASPLLFSFAAVTGLEAVATEAPMAANAPPWPTRERVVQSRHPKEGLPIRSLPLPPSIPYSVTLGDACSKLSNLLLEVLHVIVELIHQSARRRKLEVVATLPFLQLVQLVLQHRDLALLLRHLHLRVTELDFQ
mmetsp:Transcript_7945/g.19606  ORF Transcript_7945/g.19606 Transcript_7945/m.19606 type:complete len:180 (-) Transcript_7945:297-836(-)